MIDRAWLSSWIRPDHLTEEAVEAHARAFREDAARLVVLQDFLLEPIAERLSRFLRQDAEYGPEYGLYSRDEGVSLQEWESAAEEDRFFRFSKLVGIRPDARLSPTSMTYLQFRQALQSEPFKGYFEQVSGLPLTTASEDIGVHAFRSGDFLKSHDDENRNRSLALVLYLAPDWEPRLGGTLRMVDRHGRVSTVEAAYNSLVAFDVAAGTSHAVSAVEEAAGDRTRVTIGGWYHRPG